MGDSTTTVPRTGDESPQEGQAPSVSADSSGHTVSVVLPADSSYVSLVRTTTATLAAKLGFTIDDIEDLRIAVDEACAMLLSSATPDATLTCTFELRADTLGITVIVPSSTGAVPKRNSFGWTVLSALAGGADAGSQDGNSWISLHKQRDSQAS